VNDVDDELSGAFAAAHPTGADLAVVIAAYNEEDGVGDVVRAVPAVVCGLGTEVIVVVDGATDGTAAAAESAGALVCDVPVNRGQGAALRLGYRLARERGASYVATLDADGQYDPAELPLVVAPLVAGTADFVTGSRRLGRSFSVGRVRAIGVVVFGALITALTGTRVTDPANGLRAMRSSVTGAVELTQPQYQASELLVGAIMRGFRVAEVPTTMRMRSAGATKKGGNLRYGWRFSKVVVGTWWRERSGSTKMTNS
jgi:glycosyl transferase family 2